MTRSFAPGLTVSVEERPNNADILVLEQGLFEFESERLGPPQHVQMALFLRDGDGKVMGGIDAHFMWCRLFVKTMWIDARLRGLGHGGRLLALAEKEAQARSCLGVWLTALGERARGFYEKLDYRTVGEIVDYVGGQSLYTLEKRFA